jgi:hypothetical protein
VSALVFQTRAEQRRSKVLAGFPSAEHPELNGIDYVEVYEAAKVAAFPGVRVALDGPRLLRVRFLQPVGLGQLRPEHILINGGERIPVVRAERLHRGPLRSEGDNLDLWVLVDRSGDWSTYTLALVATRDAERPPPGFDPVLSRVPLSFKIDCASNLDCAPSPSPTPELSAGPVIDYLGRDFQAFRQLMLDRMSTLAPSWTERNVADLGVTLVEAIAHVADGLSYFQDAVATEAYLATARRRVSVRRHARLLDYRMHEGSSARALVSVQVEAGQGLDGTLLRAGAQLLTQQDDATPGVDAASARRGEALVFETLHDTRLWATRNLLFVHTWGEDDLILPAGSTSAVLVQPPGPAVLARGDVIVFVEQYAADPDDPTVGARRFAERSRRHAVRLLSDPAQLPAGSDPLQPSLSLMEIRWHARDALPFDLCFRVFDRPSGDAPQPGASDPDKVTACVALGNVILVDHGGVVSSEPLPGPVAGRRYRPTLRLKDLAYTVPYDAAASAAQPVVEALQIDAKQARPAITLSGDGRTWVARDDLLASDGNAEEFVVEMREDRRAVLRFGDGIRGRAPERALQAVYRVGGGSAGNVAAGAICHLVVDGALTGAVLAVENPLPARGGSDPEPLERVKQLAPEYFKAQERAVRPEDYQEIARRHPEVQQAVASFRWTGSWRTVRVTVDRVGARPVDAAFQRELSQFLEPFRMAGHDLEVRPPLFVPLHVALVVRTRATVLESEVETAIRDVLGAGRRRDGTLGFFHPDRSSFGQTLYFSNIVAEVMAVSGVERVDLSGGRVRFERFEDPDSSGLRDGQLRFGPLEIPRLDANPNLPENGRLDLYLEGGL